MWVFGYGSLIWKADFPYEEVLVGYIKGYVRRFYQKSTDHRGIPSEPGRVVTLLNSDNSNDEVWGVAYKLSPQYIDTVVKHLDYREKGGYERKSVLFYPSYSIKNTKSYSLANNISQNNYENENLLSSVSENTPFYITIYIGGEGNPNFAGIEDIYTIAKQILVSHGPSGANTEYLYNLASAMRVIAPGINDEHLYTLEAIVKTLEQEKNVKINLDKNLCINENG
ncbi:PREDICTED: putative glutathione-specific gamma-glutamylcyclotransferase 2 [Eufriesea mexicana]|uniref:putative glutathione-specific gamma-glutamylcyclotransferase 2 n=1 Tax=Eufriesea mexicana TaxID=516756 RepID=UPI00083C1480|nr:PREDICTED: putative glutathione-specific gamma-glutamylcyclotransferase 2 [Eufriesea mexicana]